MPTYNPYVSQYVAAPTEEFLKAGQAFQQEYDENMLAGEKFRTLMSSVKVLDAHKPYLAQQLKQYQDGLGAVAKDGAWEDAGLKVRNLATSFGENASSGDIATMRSTYENYQLRNQEKAKLGGEYAAWNDDWLGYEKSGGIDPKTGKPLAYTFTGLGKAQDHYKRATDVMGNIAEDETVRAGMVPNADGTGYVFTKDKNGGVSLKKIKDIAAAKASSFMTTVEGRDYLKMRQYHAGRQLTPQEQYDASKDYLEQAALQQFSIKHDEDINQKFLPEHLLKKPEDDQELNATTSYTDAAGNPLAANVADAMDGYDFDPDGKLVKVVKSGKYTQEEMAAFAAAGVQGDLNNSIVRTAIPADDVVGQNLQKTLAVLQANYQKTHKRPISNQALWKQYQASLKNHQNVFVDSKDFSPEMQKAKTNQLAPDGDPLTMFSGRRVVLLDVGENGGGKPYQSAGDLPDDIQELLADRNTKVSVVNRSLTNPYGMPGGYVVSVTNHGSGKGKVVSKKFLINASPEEEQASGTLGLLSNARYSGAPQTDIPLPMQKDGKTRYLRVINEPTREGKFLQRVEMREKHPAGIDRLVETETMDDAVQSVYREQVAPQLKRFRLTSTGQANAKGAEKNYNTNEDEDDE